MASFIKAIWHIFFLHVEVEDVSQMVDCLHASLGIIPSTGNRHGGMHLEHWHSLRRWTEGDKKVEVVLVYIMNLRLTWVVWEPVLYSKIPKDLQQCKFKMP